MVWAHIDGSGWDFGGGSTRGARLGLTFMPATSPVDRGTANAGPFPPEEMVARALVSVPSCLITNDWSAPCVFSFVALPESQDKDTHRGIGEDSLKNALVRRVECNPRRVGSGRGLVDKGERAGI